MDITKSSIGVLSNHQNLGWNINKFTFGQSQKPMELRKPTRREYSFPRWRQQKRVQDGPQRRWRFSSASNHLSLQKKYSKLETIFSFGSIVCNNSVSKSIFIFLKNLKSKFEMYFETNFERKFFHFKFYLKI